MKLNKYKEIHRLGGDKITQASIVFLIKNDQILLGQRKGKIGNGYWVGIGGKKEENESIEKAAVREVAEEIGVKIEQKNLICVGHLDFYFLNKLSWNQRAYMYFCENWEGEISESNEIKPKWFKFDKIPYEQMWDDSIYYFPFILKKKKMVAEFLYDGMEVVEVRSRIYK